MTLGNNLPDNRKPLPTNTRVDVGNRLVITLYCDTARNTWFASHSGNGSDDIRKLFGTTTLPTPFTAQAKPETVHSTIARLNPTALVMLESEAN